MARCSARKRGLWVADAKERDRVPGAVAPVEAYGRPGVERRQLTVMFCDLAGSTRLSSRLDPEDLGDVLSAFLRCCSTHIAAAGGYVARFMGDGVLAYFGYPEVREDDALRAVNAALRIRQHVPQLAVAHGPLAVRIGIATGVVVVGEPIGDGAAQERSVVGPTPNLAARLQGCAGRNDVIVSEETRRLTERRFSYDELGARRLKGLPAATPLHRLVGLRPAEERPPPPARAPFAGRHAECAWLARQWEAAAAGRGRIVQIDGPAGIGKTRLIEELRRSAGTARWLEGEASDILAATALQPVATLIRRALGRPRGPDGSRRRLRRWMTRDGAGEAAAVDLVAGLLGWETASSRLLPSEQRAQLFATLGSWLLSAARRRPTIAVLEDLQWADPSTREFLEALAPTVASVPVLVVCTTRNPVVRDQGPETQLTLGPLDIEEVEAIVRGVAGERAGPADVAAAIARADGVPLFAEELAKLIARGAAGSAFSPIPATLADLLMARIDSLGADKGLAQVAAVLGPDGVAPVLAACSGVSEAEAAAALARMDSAGVLGKWDPRSGAYAFRHALVREAAYHALLKRERAALHRRVAITLSRRRRGQPPPRPEVMGYHWSQAGDPKRALSAWTNAARLAAARRACGEAERAYAAAIAELAKLSASPSRSERELELWGGLAAARQITHGYSSREAVEAARRARRLAQRGGDIRQQFRSGADDWIRASSAGDYGKARPLAERLFRLAKADGGVSIMGSACMMLITSRYRMGDLLAAEEAFELGEPCFRAEGFRRRTGASAQAFGNAAVNAWILDKRDAAHLRNQASLESSLASGDAYEAAFARYMAGMQLVLMGDLEAGAELAERALAQSQEGRFPQYEATSRIVLGRALAGLGRPGEGFRLVEAGLAEMGDKTHSRAGLTLYLTWRAEVLALAADFPAMLAACDLALTANPAERFMRPEGLRLRGQARAALGQAEAAAMDLRAALTLARQIGATLFERRAQASLAAAC